MTCVVARAQAQPDTVINAVLVGSEQPHVVSDPPKVQRNRGWRGASTLMTACLTTLTVCLTTLMACLTTPDALLRHGFVRCTYGNMDLRSKAPIRRVPVSGLPRDRYGRSLR